MLGTEAVGEFSSETTVTDRALRCRTRYARRWARRSWRRHRQTHGQVQRNKMFMWTDDTHEVKLEQQQAGNVLSETSAVALNVTDYLLHTNTRYNASQWTTTSTQSLAQSVRSNEFSIILQPFRITDTYLADIYTWHLAAGELL